MKTHTSKFGVAATAAMLMAFLAAQEARTADVKYSMEMSAGAGAGMPAFRSTVYVKEQQERRDMDMMGQNLSTITNCERRQTLTINWKCKLYLAAPLDPEGGPMMPAMSPRGAEPERKGGLVVVENEFRDTGERKTLFGLPARHVIMNMKMDAKEGSCNPGHTEIENDLWVVNVTQPACRRKPGEGAPPVPQRGGCRDQYQHTSRGNASLAFGLPVVAKMTFTTPQGQRQTMMTEIKDLSVGPLEASLFEIPAGFQEAKSQQDLYMCGMGMGQMAETMRQAQQAARAERAPSAEPSTRKGSGEWRIGVILTDRSGRLDSAMLANRLVADIKEIEGFDAVRIDSRTPPEIQQEATEKKCNFLLYADIREAKSSGSGLGGVLGRRAGIGGRLDAKHNIGMDYRLTLAPPPGEEVARDALSHSSSDVGSERPSIEDVATSFMQRTAERATEDARQWKARQKQ